MGSSLLKKEHRIAILGAGNIGVSMATGLVESGGFSASSIILTRRRIHLLDGMQQKGYGVEARNDVAVRESNVVIIAVEPQQIDEVLAEISPILVPDKHTLISVVSGVNIDHIKRLVRNPIPIIRAMPNTAIAISESMTCLASGEISEESKEIAVSIFDSVGKTMFINEDEMVAATALGACGVAFFLRAIRAASQGGIEIGFNAEVALAIAAQTAKGAASLLLTTGNHPEHEIDKVTTPRGCTIAGLNQMEHDGFSSALIKGITVSASIAQKLQGGDE